MLFIFAVAILIGKQPADESRFDTELPGQLQDDLTSLSPAERAGDSFTTLDAIDPPSLARERDPSVVSVEELLPDASLGPEPQLEPDLASPFGAVGMPKMLTSPFSGRRGDARARLVRREGGTVESEAAVERGLDWIARHQRRDGSWGLDNTPQCRDNGCPKRPASESDTAATGLALLPMLGAGQSHREPGRYQGNVDRGIGWLVKVQKPDGDLFTGGGGNTHMYSHAIATMALCEAYGLTRDPGLRAPSQKAIDFIVHAQRPKGGGWRYNPGQEGDTSVFGWQMLALRSAYLAGLKVPDDAIRDGLAYLDRAAADKPKTTYAYQPGGQATPVMTAEALLVRQYVGWDRSYPPMVKGAGLVASHLLRSEDRNVYYWYYATQLLHNLQNDGWRHWNAKVRETLIATQVKGNGCDRGSWDPLHPKPDQWGRSAGRHFVTAMSLLTLEVYYRYLPIYKSLDTNPLMRETPH